jgi:sugar O-acyltransferase (sialic acid O-acetyltransferase NeuD family)
VINLKDEIILIGYAGHGYVVAGILRAMGTPATSYCDNEEKKNNPFGLIYLGNEKNKAALEKIKTSRFFISIGDNSIRKKIFDDLDFLGCFSLNVIHPGAIIDETASIRQKGVMIAAGVCINPLAKIGNGVICNTACIIEHECVIEDFAHIAPGAILCGNVYVGSGSFVGAGAVIKQGISIGKNVIIGAGAVVLKNIADNEIVAGNPAKKIIK